MKLPPPFTLLLAELLLHLGDAQPVGDQLVGIQANLVFTRRASEAGHVDHVGYGLECLLDHPVLERLQFHDVVLGIGAVQGEEVDLADRAPVRANLRLQALGQRYLREPLDNFRAIPIVNGVVVENHGDARKPGQRYGAQILKVRNPVHYDLNGNRDLLLHFLRGPPRPLRDDRDVVVGDIGIRLDREVVERDCAPDQQQNRGCKNQKAIGEGKVDQGLNHFTPSDWRRRCGICRHSRPRSATNEGSRRGSGSVRETIIF